MTKADKLVDKLIDKAIKKEVSPKELTESVARLLVACLQSGGHLTGGFVIKSAGSKCALTYSTEEA